MRATLCATSDPTPMNHSNKSGKPPAESEEGRPLIKENTHQLSTHSTQSEARVSQGLAGVRKAARDRKEMKFTALLHHLTVALLRDSFYALKRQAAPGVDGVTWQEYETGLEGRLVDLHSRVHRGAYRAQPSRRVYIPKPDGRQRPLGSPHWRTKSFNRQWLPSSIRFTRRIFGASRMVSGQGAASIKRWMRCPSRSRGRR